ncbi:MAG: DEAD-box ATP dependent DNA helicase [uncultured bacterium]|nr:MAG: DEAD-box ATP dependent DNA helicase [uncultured bacterium]
MKLEEIKSAAVIKGIDPKETVRIVSVDAAGPDAVTVYYKTASGKLLERMLFRSDESNLILETPGRPWAFDVDGDKTECPYYVKKPFTQETDWAVTSINMDIRELIKKANNGKI